MNKIFLIFFKNESDFYTFFVHFSQFLIKNSF
nr:MAG TPA: hypothetical protein [Caudoviricetes sp.]